MNPCSDGSRAVSSRGKRCVSSLLNVRAGSNIRRGRCSTARAILAGKHPQTSYGEACLSTSAMPALSLYPLLLVGEQCRAAPRSSHRLCRYVGVFASFTAPVNVDQFRIHVQDPGLAGTWHGMASIPCRVGHLGRPDTSNYDGSRRYDRVRDMDTQPNTRTPDTSIPGISRGGDLSRSL